MHCILTYVHLIIGYQIIQSRILNIAILANKFLFQKLI